MEKQTIKSNLDGNWSSRNPRACEYQSQQVHFYKNKRAKEIYVTSKKGKAHSGYTLIRDDLKLCSAWLDLLEANMDKIAELPKSDDGDVYIRGNEGIVEVSAALLIAVYITYGKCFTVARGRRLKLQKKDISSRYFVTHEKLIKARHEFAAHAGEGDYEEAVTVMLFGSPQRTGLPVALTGNTTKIQFDVEEIKEFRAIVSYLYDLVVEKLSKIEASIFEDFQVKGLEYWAKKAKIVE